MKKTLIIISIFFSLIIILLAALPFIVDINDIIAVQIPKIEKTINRKVSIGKVRLTLFDGLGAQINDVNISDRLDSNNNNFIAFESIRIGIKLIPLLNGKIVIDDIGLINPFIFIERNQNGKFNFSDMMSNNKSKETPAVLQESKKSFLPSILHNVEISKIYIKNGKINFNDNMTNANLKQICLDDFDINLKDISLQKKISINLHSNVLLDSQVGKIAISGQIGPMNKELDINKIPLDINVIINNLNLSAIKQFTKAGINFKSGSLTPNISLKGNIENGFDIGIQVKWDNFIAGISLQENHKPDYIRINGPWDIKSSIKDIAKEPNLNCIIQMDDSELSYGTLVFKPQEFPLNMNCQIKILKNSALINSLKFRLGDLVLTSAAKLKNFSSLFVELSANIPKTEISNIIDLVPILSKYKIKTSMDMVIDCRGKIDDLIALKGIQAGLNIYDASLFVPELNKNIQSLRSTFLVDKSSIYIEDTGFSIGSSSIDFEADIKDLKNPKISFNMISPWLDIDELLPANSKKEASSTIQSDKPIEKADTKQSTLPSLSISGIVKVDKGKYKDVGFSDFYTKVSGTNAKALLDQIKLNIFSGTITGNGKIDLSDTNAPTWQLDLNATNIETNTMISSFSSIKDILYGTFTGNFKIQGKGDDVQTVLESLTAAGSTSIKNGQLKNISIIDMLGQALVKSPNLGNLSGIVLSDQSDKEDGIETTQFNDLSAAFDIANGKLETKLLKMIADDYIVDAKGTMGLDLGLNFTGNADISESVISNMAQDKILSQFLDERGHFVFPFALKGTLLKPSISIDKQFFADKLRQATKTQTQKVIEKTFGKDVNETTKKFNEGLKKLFN